MKTISDMSEMFNFHGKQMEVLFNLTRKSKKLPIHSLDTGSAEQVKINGKYPEGDFDREKGEHIVDNDFSS